MALIRNKTSDARVVPVLGDAVVTAGDTVEVPDSQVDAYTCQTAVWELVKQPKESKAAPKPAAPKESD